MMALHLPLGVGEVSRSQHSRDGATTDPLTFPVCGFWAEVVPVPNEVREVVHMQSEVEPETSHQAGSGKGPGRLRRRSPLALLFFFDLPLAFGEGAGPIRRRVSGFVPKNRSRAPTSRR